MWESIKLLLWLSDEEKKTLEELKRLRTLQVSGRGGMRVDVEEIWEDNLKNKLEREEK